MYKTEVIEIEIPIRYLWEGCHGDLSTEYNGSIGPEKMVIGRIYWK